MISANEERRTFLQHRPRSPQGTTAYPPKPRPAPLDVTQPGSSRGRGWVGQLFQYREPPSAAYQSVRGEEELAPLHRLHDEEDVEDGDSNEEFEVVDRDRDGQ